MIRQVHITNYRSIRDVALLLPKFAAIVGKNGTGKSNFISAITLLKRLVRGLELDVATLDIAPFGKEMFPFQDHRDESTFEFLIQTHNGHSYIFRFTLALKRVAGAMRLAVDTESLVKTEADDRRHLVYKRERDKTYEGDDKKDISFKAEPDRLMLTNYGNEDARTVRTLVAGYTIVEVDPQFKRDLQVIDGEKPDLNTIDGVAVSLFLKNNARFEKAVRSIQNVIPHFDAPEIHKIPKSDGDKKAREELNRYIVMWKEKGYPASYSHLTLSSGDKRVISLIFNLFNTPDYSFMATEEIENGMHIERLSRLIDELRTQANNQKVQLLFTTHSIEILKCLTVEQLIWCHKDDDNGTKLILVKNSKEFEMMKENFEALPNAADVIKSGLFS